MKNSIIALLLSSAMISALILAVATYAQEPEEVGEPKGAEAQGQVGGFGIADPPGPGQTVLYMFTGAADNRNFITPTIATSIHCANFGSTAAIIEVQIIDRDSSPVITDTETIPPNGTVTLSTQGTQVYDEHASYGGILPGTSDDINQGSGRIMADISGSTDVICTVQVLDPINNPPTFIAKLTLFDGNGNFLGSVRKIYLPIIIKDS